jgi:hypothetical protein
MADIPESGAGTALEPPPTPAALSLPPPAVPAPDPRPLWRNRDYVLLWSGQVVSTLGSSVSGIAVPLLILALTQSPEAAGIAGRWAASRICCSACRRVPWWTAGTASG